MFKLTMAIATMVFIALLPLLLFIYLNGFVVGLLCGLLVYSITAAIVFLLDWSIGMILRG